MTDEPGIERRSLLRAITAASGTALSLAVLSRPAAACPTGEVAAADSEHFETAEIGTGNNTIFFRLYGRGSALLMVLGFARTCLMWGYGAYESCDDPEFDVALPSLLDRGVVYALTHPRGAGTYWHSRPDGERRGALDHQF